MGNRRRHPGRSSRPGRSHGSDLAAAAEAAGAAVSQVFLAVRPCGSRNRREGGNGQSEGQNNLRHLRLLWFVMLYRRQAGWPTAHSLVPGASSCGCEAVHRVGFRLRCAGSDCMLSAQPDGGLEGEVRLVLFLAGDSLEISAPYPDLAARGRAPLDSPSTSVPAGHAAPEVHAGSTH
jgi:hypothetical protein